MATRCFVIDSFSFSFFLFHRWVFVGFIFFIIIIYLFFFASFICFLWVSFSVTAGGGKVGGGRGEEEERLKVDRGTGHFFVVQFPSDFLVWFDYHLPI